MPGQDLQAEQDAAERLAKAHDALAEAQDRSYWLDRWQLDLNELMRRPGAYRVRAALRGARGVRRSYINARRRVAEAVLYRDTGADDVVPQPHDEHSSAFARSLSPRPVTSSPVTDTLFGRLTEEDVAAIEAALEPEEAAILNGAGHTDRRRYLLSLGVHHGIPGATERTGLVSAVPPADVHAMARGAVAAGGSAYYGDLVVDALTTAGFELADGMRALDFGCSSGRVVRALQAAYPDVEWHGCDPIPEAIDWASANLPAIEFLQNPEEPPLPYGDRSLDVVYAISIWSHFAEPAALAWLDEMHRLLRPGGMLVLSTHGPQSITHDSNGIRGHEQLAEVRAALFKHGFWFRDEFGADRDHSVGGAEWGTAFLTTEWLAWHAAPRWKIAAFAPGRLEDNQDLYTLERR